MPLYARRARDVLAKRIFEDCRLIFSWSARCSTLTKYRACRQTQGVQLYALHVESLVQRNLEKPLKLTRKSIQNREQSHLRDALALGSVDFWRSGRLDGATQCDSGRCVRPGAAKAAGPIDQAARLVAQHARACKAVQASCGNIVIDINNDNINYL